MPIIIKTENLTRQFGKLIAVNNLNLQVEEGDVYGFLGLNGAGKTTTIRMLLRLIRPSSGRIEIFGKDVRHNFIEIMQQIGALVEIPAFYPHLTAYQNLYVLGLASGGITKNRIYEVLEMVGLGHRIYSKVKTYSQGMKQRLGIAQALLTKPKLVILDEPTNGLDPQGINHIRNVIMRMNAADGTTFLISSHLLHEVEIICSRVGIIQQGALLVQDRVDKLLRETIESVRILAKPKERTLEVLGKINWLKGIEEIEDGIVKVKLNGENFARLNKELIGAGLEVSEFSPIKLSLEEYFLTKSYV